MVIQRRMYTHLWKRFMYRCTKLTRNYHTQQSADSNKFKNDISRQLIMKIKAGGPITIANYMKEVLLNPFGGYYMHRDVFGTQGDFVTSPELSQVFGELIAIWFLNEWSKAGSPKPLQIVELGPGRGTLCNDILRVFSHFGQTDRTSIHLVELSPHLTRLQAQTLCTTVQIDDDSNCVTVQKGTSAFGAPIYWYKHLDDVPEAFTLFLAHEFFDALPIHQFKKTDLGYREILIDLDPLTKMNFRYVLSRGETPIGKLFIDPLESRQFVEVSPEALSITHKIAKRIEHCGGLALIVDYGHDGRGITDSFRAFKNHQLHDPLIEPGTADLTADVDFAAIKKVALKDNEVLVFGPISQSQFLANMGIEHRLQKLKTTATPKQKDSLDYSYSMLVDPKKMGERFKFFAITPATLSVILNKYPICGFQ